MTSLRIIWLSLALGVDGATCSHNRPEATDQESFREALKWILEWDGDSSEYAWLRARSEWNEAISISYFRSTKTAGFCAESIGKCYIFELRKAPLGLGQVLVQGESPSGGLKQFVKDNLPHSLAWRNETVVVRSGTLQLPLGSPSYRPQEAACVASSLRKWLSVRLKGSSETARSVTIPAALASDQIIFVLHQGIARIGNLIDMVQLDDKGHWQSLGYLPEESPRYRPLKEHILRKQVWTGKIP
jgi:hypothetical protein